MYQEGYETTRDFHLTRKVILLGGRTEKILRGIRSQTSVEPVLFFYVSILTDMFTRADTRYQNQNNELESYFQSFSNQK